MDNACHSSPNDGGFPGLNAGFQTLEINLNVVVIVTDMEYVLLKFRKGSCEGNGIKRLETDFSRPYSTKIRL